MAKLERILVNIGCGNIIHRSWRNYDVNPSCDGAQKLDVRKGVPLPDESCDAVYSSHVLEHLSRKEGERMIRECYRLLKPGGVIRVVVPDLEVIARLYLEALEKQTEHIDISSANYDWMVLEMLDQLVRVQSGGEMKRYWSQSTFENESFIEQRMGWQFLEVRGRLGNAPLPGRYRTPVFDLARKVANKTRKGLLLIAINILGGREAKAAFKEGAFRRGGEIHRWMYDRYSLATILKKCDFRLPKTVRYNESAIRDFESFSLDSWNGQPRKPDSLYMEATK